MSLRCAYSIMDAHALRADDVVVAFFESPQGTAFLGNFMVALFLVFDLGTSSGLRHIGRFLTLSGFGPFVAASFGACQRYSLALASYHFIQFVFR